MLPPTRCSPMPGHCMALLHDVSRHFILPQYEAHVLLAASRAGDGAPPSRAAPLMIAR